MKADLGFLSSDNDFSSPEAVRGYDEAPLWSAMFGLLLLDEVPLANVSTALDVGCGAGFPLIELAERLGPAARVHGLDLWKPGLERAAEKIASRRASNVTLVEGSATAMPFPDASFDLIVSNLGVNNFEDRAGAMRECRRVARAGATIALTSNLVGHMKEFYAVYGEILRDDAQSLDALRAHINHRATVPKIRQLLQDAGFTVTRVVEREGVMRFKDGTALLNHDFIKRGFLDGWKKVVPGREEPVFEKLLRALDGELRLTIPMAYVEARS